MLAKTAIEVGDKEFPKIKLSAEEIKGKLGTTDAPRNADGSIDLSQSPLTKYLAEKERAAFEQLSTKAGAQVTLAGQGNEMDAFQRQLVARGLDGSSPLSAMLSAFWDPSEIGIFAEYIERAIFLSENTLTKDEIAPSDLITSTKQISGTMSATFPSLNLTSNSSDDKKAKRTVSGASTKTYELTESDETLNLDEYGFKIKIQDLAKASETVDTASILIQDLAAENVLRAQVSAMVAIAVAASAGTGFNEAREITTSSLVWEDILKFFYGGSYPSRFPQFAFTCNNATGAIISMIKILNLATLVDPIAVPGAATKDVIPALRGRQLKFHAGSTLKDKLIGLNKTVGFIKAENRAATQSEWERVATGGWSVYHWKSNWAFRLITDSAITRLVKT